MNDVVGNLRSCNRSQENIIKGELRDRDKKLVEMQKRLCSAQDAVFLADRALSRAQVEINSWKAMYDSEKVLNAKRIAELEQDNERLKKGSKFGEFA